MHFHPIAYEQAWLELIARIACSTLWLKMQMPPCGGTFLKSFAEKEGFEPPIPFGMPVFKTGAINHSATSPVVEWAAKVCLSFLTHRTRLNALRKVDLGASVGPTNIRTHSALGSNARKSSFLGRSEVKQDF